MAELTGNSFKDRQGEKATEDRKFDKVVSNKTELRPKNEAQKLAGLLGPNIVGDVIMPAVKDTISDVIAHLFDMTEDAIRMSLFPDMKPRSGRRRRGGYDERVSYGGYYKSDRDRGRRYANERSSAFDLEDVIFRTRGEAETVLYTMDEAIDRYGVVTVGDFYDMSDISTTNMPHTLHKYGWTDIRNARINPVRGGFIIKLPRSMPID